MAAATLAGRILVVEDEPDIRELLAELLSELGPVEQAVDGIDALERIALGGPPAVILLDLCLPRLSGPELLLRLRGLALDGIPVVTMTASHASPPSGVCAHLKKPFPLERALSAVRRAVTEGAPALAGARQRPSRTTSAAAHASAAPSRHA